MAKCPNDRQLIKNCQFRATADTRKEFFLGKDARMWYTYATVIPWTEHLEQSGFLLKNWKYYHQDKKDSLMMRLEEQSIIRRCYNNVGG